MPDTASLRNSWAPVLTLTVAAFIFNTSEFVPIGLLSDLASSFAVSEATAGLVITAYAWVVLFASLPLILLFSRMDFKYLLALILACMTLSQAATALSQSFGFLLGSRLAVALCHALFWSIACPLAVKIAPAGQASKAVGLVAAGTAVAMVGGMPLGRVIGLYVGWRVTFALLGLISLALLIAVLAVLPRVPGVRSPVLTVLPRIVKNGPLMGLYVVTALIFTANYTPYSYIEPYLALVGSIAPAYITLALILFGVAAIVSSILFSRGYDGHEKLFIYFAFGGLTVFLALLHVLTFNLTLTLADCFLWGLAFSVFSLSFQALVIRLESEYSAIATSIYSSICNLGIGAGAFVGSHILDYADVRAIGYVGAALALTALIILRLKLMRRWFGSR